MKNLRDRIIGRIAKNYYAPLGRETFTSFGFLPDGILFGSCTGTTTLSTNYDHCHGKMEVSLLENKAELQLVETAILIGQFQSDRAF